jgi:uncharacterized protein (TIGR03083 family)
MAAYSEMRLRLTDLLADVPDDLAVTTPVPTCPGWSVTDLAAHVYGVPRDVLDGNVAEAGSPEWTSSQVERFAPMGLAALVAGWNEIAPGFEDAIAGFPDLIAGRIAFDSGVHEHDLRGALGRPGGRDAPSVMIGLEFMAEGMGNHIGREGLRPLEYATPGFAMTLGNGSGRVRLETDTFTLYRVTTGRRSLAQIRALHWDGDPEPYLTVFDDTPLRPPEVDIEE